MPLPSPLNILIVGIYRSGSSAVVDYLKGHPDVSAPEGEFTEFKSPDRIGDLLSKTSTAEAKRLTRKITWETRFARMPRSWLKERQSKPNIPLKYRVEQNGLKLKALANHRRGLEKGQSPQNPEHF